LNVQRRNLPWRCSRIQSERAIDEVRRRGLIGAVTPDVFVAGRVVRHFHRVLEHELRQELR